MFHLDAYIDLESVYKTSATNTPVTLTEGAEKAIQKCRSYLEEKIKRADAPIYGINTGFGSLCNTTIPDADLEKLQLNLVQSHACGTGTEVPAAIVKLMLLLKAMGLSKGYSGVQLATVQLLLELYNRDILPVVYNQGSLGASGDLAPLAHLSMPLLGLGEVYYKGKKQNAASALEAEGLKPIRLSSKEGLALLNGTQFMSSYGTYCVVQAKRIAELADLIAALSVDAFDVRKDPFMLPLHTIRPHNGQLKSAAAVLEYLKDSEIAASVKTQVQDPYSFRCVPQVHGASHDTIAYVSSVLATEVNAVTDNPTVFPDEDMVLSGGNFHGQPLALALDFLAIALAELGSISERRTYLLISGQRNLPPFLAKEPGLNSGFMIPQYTAASIVSQNKQLCSPASVDSIPSSNGQEDHVSMGANAATKCYQVLENVKTILAIELFNAAQALEFRRPAKSSPAIEKFVAAYRKLVPFLSADTFMQPLIAKSREFVNSQC